MFIQLLWERPDLYFTWVVLVVFSICVHEACHAWTAHWQGDSTAVDNGFLTLNPLKVMGRWSLLFVALIGFAWGAVPVIPSRFRSKASHAIVSISGPFANATLAVAFGGLLIAVIKVTGPGGSGESGVSILRFFLSIGIRVNVFLALFNMLPIPILDGWEVFSLIFPALKRIPTQQARQYGFIALLVILFSGLHYFLWDVGDLAVDMMVGWAEAG